MSIIKTTAVIIGFLLVTQSFLHAQPDGVDSAGTGTKNTVFRDYIKTVLLVPAATRYGDAVISTMSGSRLLLMFDDLRNNFNEYYFDIRHCDRNWELTEEVVDEYYVKNGSSTIDDYIFSSGTSTGYCQYTLTFPRDGERFTKSGNFIIRVFETSSDSLILIWRFFVVQPKVTVEAEIVKPDNNEFGDYQQQIKFEISDPNSFIEDISELHVVVTKNAGWEMRCEQLRPSFVSNNRISYTRTDQCHFEGGNEYRSFNILEYKNISNNIIRSNFNIRGYMSFWLDDDKPRSYLQYSYQQDINGRMRFDGDNKKFNPNQLDYAEVHFTLAMEDAMLGYEIYLYGGLTNFSIDQKFKMEFNPDNGKYELSTLLKQGFYNYEYVVKSIYQEQPDEGLIEGSHFITENDYRIFVYYHSVKDNCDLLIAVGQLNSQNKIRR